MQFFFEFPRESVFTEQRRQKFILERLFQGAAIGGIIYSSAMIELHESSVASEIVFLAIIPSFILALLSIIFYVLQIRYSYTTCVLGCLENCSRYTASFQTQRLLFDRPSSGNRDEYVKCQNCGQQIKVKVWSSSELLRKRCKLVVWFGLYLVLAVLLWDEDWKGKSIDEGAFAKHLIHITGPYALYIFYILQIVTAVSVPVVALGCVWFLSRSQYYAINGISSAARFEMRHVSLRGVSVPVGRNHQLFYDSTEGRKRAGA